MTTLSTTAPRTAEVSRNTAETKITVKVNLDGTGHAKQDGEEWFFISETIGNVLDLLLMHEERDAGECARTIELPQLAKRFRV